MDRPAFLLPQHLLAIAKYLAHLTNIDTEPSATTTVKVWIAILVRGLTIASLTAETTAIEKRSTAIPNHTVMGNLIMAVIALTRINPAATGIPMMP